MNEEPKKENKKLRQKIWMLSAIADTLSGLPKFKDMEAVQKTREAVEKAKTAFRGNEEEKAKEEAATSLKELKAVLECLPSRARKQINKQLKSSRITKNG